MSRAIAWTLGLLALLLWGPYAALAEPVAITFDDLPTLGLTASPGYAQITTLRLVRALRRRQAPAIGFVVGEKIGTDPAVARARLRPWLDAGFELGNHTYSHVSLDHTSPAAFIADIARDDEILRSLPSRRGGVAMWFRYPYLETGATLDDTQAVKAWLAAHGHRIAPVTLENSDYLFALPYDQAILRRDRRRARAIRNAYLAYSDRAVAWYRGAALQLLGRRPALIFLLHASRLNADCVDRLLDILHRNHLRPVSLESASRDPAYALPDDRLDPDGDEWLSRWAMSLNRELPWDRFPEPPRRIAAQGVRMDTDP